MKKVPIIIILAILSISFVSIKIDAQPSAEIVSQTSYVTPTGIIYILAEIENTGTTSLRILINTTYYNASGHIIGVTSRRTRLAVVPPNIKTPFTTVSTFPNTSSYSLEIHSLEIVPTPIPRLRILSHINYTDENGYLHIIGELEDLGGTPEDIFYTNVMATGYNSTGDIVAFSETLSRPYETKKGEKAFFNISIVPPERASLVTSYVIIAEAVSDYYYFQSEPIPEFHFPLIMVLLVILTIFNFFKIRKIDVHY